jgi:hypothetical protein
MKPTWQPLMMGRIYSGWEDHLRYWMIGQTAPEATEGIVNGAAP